LGLTCIIGRSPPKQSSDSVGQHQSIFATQALKERKKLDGKQLFFDPAVPTQKHEIERNEMTHGMRAFGCLCTNIQSPKTIFTLSVPDFWLTEGVSQILGWSPIVGRENVERTFTSDRWRIWEMVNLGVVEQGVGKEIDLFLSFVAEEKDPCKRCDTH